MHGKSLVEAFDSRKEEVDTLLGLSDKYHQQAKLIVSGAHSKQDLELFYRLVKLSIKCLKMIFSRYNEVLDPKAKAVVYFKLADLYFNEVRDYPESESLITKLIAICHRNKYTDLHVAGIVLYLKITSSVDPEYSYSRLKEFMFIFRDSSNITCLLYILFYQLFDHSTTAKKRPPIKTVLETASRADNEIGACLIIIAAYDTLCNGNMKDFNSVLSKVDHEVSIKQLPIQLQCMFLVVKLYACLLSGNKIEFRSTAKALDGVNQSQKGENWCSWKPSGSFSLEFNYSLINVDLQLNWLNKNQFLCILRLLVGLNIIDRLVSAALKMFESSFTSIMPLIECLQGGKVDSQLCITHLDALRRISGYLLFNVIYYSNWCKAFGFGTVKNVENYMLELGASFLDLNSKIFTKMCLADCLRHDYSRKILYFEALISVLNEQNKISIDKFSRLINSITIDDVGVYATYQRINLSLWERDTKPNSKDLERQIKRDFERLQSLSVDNIDSAHFGTLTNYVTDMLCLRNIFEIIQCANALQAQHIYYKLKEVDSSISSVFLSIINHLTCLVFERPSDSMQARLKKCLSLQERLPTSFKLLRIQIYKAQLQFMQHNTKLAAEIEEIKLKIIKLNYRS